MNDENSDLKLLERSGELEFIARGAAEALRGEGRAVAVAGDAGAGKSSLARVAVSCVGPVRVLRGSCDPLSTPRPLGPIRDIFGDLGSTLSLIEAQSTALTAVGEAAFAALKTEPTVVFIEDTQWIDDASVDVLRFILRRIGALPVLLLLTYRNDEIGMSHPLRALLGDLARAERASTLTLRPLSQAAVAELLAGTRLDPATVLRTTGGNPFFVTEIARQPDEQIPLTIRDAVLASTAGLSDSDLENLQLLAAAPDGTDDRHLVALSIDVPALRRLEATGLLVRTRRGIGFRHELARLAVEDSIPPGAGPGVHARLLDALESTGSKEWALLTHHAHAAADHARATRFALAAADDAVRTGAYLEAAAFLSQALEHFEGPATDRAEILERLSFLQYMVNQLDEAFASITQAMNLWASAGDTAGVAAAHERRSIFAYYSARRDEAEEQVRLAAKTASEGGHDLRYGLAVALKGFIAYRRNDLEEALAATAVAGEIAQRTGSAILARQCALINNGVNLLLGVTRDREEMVANIDAAIASSFDELASMGFTNLAGIDVEQRRFRQAEEILERAIPFVIEREITVCQATQTSVRSRMQLLRGRWQAALEDARAVLDAEWAQVARFWPHLAIGVLALRRGEPSESLHQAWQLALQLDEPLLRLPLLSAIAERTWLTGEEDGRLQEAAAELSELSKTPGLEWSIGELAVWLKRVGIETGSLRAIAEPYRLELEGRAGEAAAWWRRAGAPFDEAMALLWSDDEDDQVAAIATFDSMGATATADRARQELRRRGVLSLPPRPRAATRSNPAGLTNRQLEVARLIAQGLTNAEMAQRLYISEKTADHHVSAVLGKLGLASRRDVQRRSAEFGLD
ncbi:MAG: AAA family ATPase [Dehalococcoidia bacterium]